MVHVGEGAIGYHRGGGRGEGEILVEGASRVDDGVVVHEGVEGERNALLPRWLRHGALLGTVERVVMKFRIELQLALSSSAAIHSRNLGREVGGALADLLEVQQC